MDFEQLIKNLKKRGFIPFFAENINECLEYIKNIIPEGVSIGFGGSETVMQTGLLKVFADRYNLLHRSLFDSSFASELYKKMHTADWYISSTNALTMDGDMINIDGRANRVAEILNGPENILIICGKNKIVENVAAGIDRVRNVAAPMNAKRLNKNTPCAITGKCANCNSPDTICKATVIQHHPTTGKNVYIIIVNENLGY